MGDAHPLLADRGVTPREAEVLAALTERLSNAEIAERLYISIRTVESHVSSLLTKLGTSNRAGLAAVGRSLGLIATEPPAAEAFPIMLASVGGAPFFGRAAELARCRRIWQEQTPGTSRVVLIAGEPGVGKTRLAAEAAREAVQEGVAVLFGQCDEEALVPYQPWAETLRQLQTAVPAPVLDAALAGADPVLNRLVPRLLAGEAAGEVERARLFEATADLLTGVCRRQPLLVIVDDLHWADRASLILLHHLIRRSAGLALYVIGTYRDQAYERGHPLLETLANLRRAGPVGKLMLSGLSLADTEQVVAAYLGDSGPPGAAETLWRETDGNPFFLHEVLRHLDETRPMDSPPTSGIELEAIGVPPGVREVVDQRVARLGPFTATVLEVASVIGRTFDLEVVARVAEAEATALSESMDAAVATRLLAEAGSGRAERFEFTHDLVRQALYRGLSRGRRLRLHRSVAEALETQTEWESHAPPAEPSRVGELAHHFRAAGDDRALGYVLQAAAAATAALAYEQAAGHYEVALDLLTGDGAAEGDRRRLDVLLALGDVRRRSGNAEAARAAFLAAFDVARAAGDPPGQARAALGLGEVASTYGQDDVLTHHLRDALGQVTGVVPELAARLQARLAQALYDVAPLAERDRLTREAEAVARSAGHNGALGFVLRTRHVALQGPDGLAERLTTAAQVVTLAEQTADPELAAHGHAWRFLDLLEAGDRDGADAEQAIHAELAERLQQPLHRRDAAMWRCLRATLEGRFSDAEQHIDETAALGLAAQAPETDVFSLALTCFLDLERGRLPGIQRFLETAVRIGVADWSSTWKACLAHAYVRSGNEDLARHHYEAVARAGVDSLPRDLVWLNTLTHLAELCAVIGDAARAPSLYRVLSPYADRMVVVDRGVGCKGSVARYLGLLAATMGQAEVAARHYAAAGVIHRRLGARPSQARTDWDAARMLATADDPASRERALECARRALAEAESLGIDDIAAEARRLLNRFSETEGHQHAGKSVVRTRGSVETTDDASPAAS